MELRDLGRQWPAAQKGFSFSSWLYIVKLNQPIVILHVAQSQKTIFRIRLLDNSQIGIQTCQNPALAEEPEEIVCPAPDALIPHREWVHFAVNCRKVKSLDIAEIRIFVNGVRVGAMRMHYPTAAVMAPVGPSQLHVRPATPPDAIRIGVGKMYTGQDGLAQKTADLPKDSVGKQEENEWMLGRVLLLEEAVPEDLMLLLHHLVRLCFYIPA
jgi:hypothetical protein